MKKIGVLAYGSLIEDPGKEIGPLIRKRIDKVETPFSVEFARTSSSRDGAPTLVPVDSKGARVQAVILVLDNSVSVKKATDLVWRRETRNEGNNKHYQKPLNPNVNQVIVECLGHFQGVDTVLYTKIGANIQGLTPEKLADMAIESARASAGAKVKDGISYLISAKRQGINTPLMLEYERAILFKTNAVNLAEAFMRVRLGHA